MGSITQRCLRSVKDFLDNQILKRGQRHITALPLFFIFVYNASMKNVLQTIFKKKQNIVIGAIHLPPLLGYSKFPGFQNALRNVLIDMRAFERGGVDGLIFENNYDIPHTTLAGPGTLISMALIGQVLRKATRLPLGVNVLWNDYEAALVLAKLLDLQFIRVPVFVDSVKTQHGIIRAMPKKVMQLRKSLEAEHIALFTDIQVKHAEMLSRRTLVQSAQLAIQNGSDTIIVTGEWTGEAPKEAQLAALRAKISSFPLLVGSGLNNQNVSLLFRHANGGIISTSLKRGAQKKAEVNVKSYAQRIDMKKVRRFVDIVKRNK